MSSIEILLQNINYIVNVFLGCKNILIILILEINLHFQKHVGSRYILYFN